MALLPDASVVGAVVDNVAENDVTLKSIVKRYLRFYGESLFSQAKTEQEQSLIHSMLNDVTPSNVTAVLRTYGIFTKDTSAAYVDLLYITMNAFVHMLRTFANIHQSVTLQRGGQLSLRPNSFQHLLKPDFSLRDGAVMAALSGNDAALGVLGPAFERLANFWKNLKLRVTELAEKNPNERWTERRCDALAKEINDKLRDEGNEIIWFLQTILTMFRKVIRDTVIVYGESLRHGPASPSTSTASTPMIQQSQNWSVVDAQRTEYERVLRKLYDCERDLGAMKNDVRLNAIKRIENYTGLPVDKLVDPAKTMYDLQKSTNYDVAEIYGIVLAVCRLRNMFESTNTKDGTTLSLLEVLSRNIDQTLFPQLNVLAFELKSLSDLLRGDLFVGSLSDLIGALNKILSLQGEYRKLGVRDNVIVHAEKAISRFERLSKIGLSPALSDERFIRRIKEISQCTRIVERLPDESTRSSISNDTLFAAMENVSDRYKLRWVRSDGLFKFVNSLSNKLQNDGEGDELSVVGKVKTDLQATREENAYLQTRIKELEMDVKRLYEELRSEQMKQTFHSFDDMRRLEEERQRLVQQNLAMRETVRALRKEIDSLQNGETVRALRAEIESLQNGEIIRGLRKEIDILRNVARPGNKRRRGKENETVFIDAKHAVASEILKTVGCLVPVEGEEAYKQLMSVATIGAEVSSEMLKSQLRNPETPTIVSLKGEKNFNRAVETIKRQNDALILECIDEGARYSQQELTNLRQKCDRLTRDYDEMVAVLRSEENLSDAPNRERVELHSDEETNEKKQFDDYENAVVAASTERSAVAAVATDAEISAEEQPAASSPHSSADPIASRTRSRRALSKRSSTTHLQEFEEVPKRIAVAPTSQNITDVNVDDANVTVEDVITDDEDDVHVGSTVMPPHERSIENESNAMVDDAVTTDDEGAEIDATLASEIIRSRYNRTVSPVLWKKRND